MPNKEFLEAIASSDFLNGCSFDSSSVIRKAYSAGAYLSDNNNGKGFIGLIASGILNIYSVALDGRDTMLNSLHKGNCFGICNLFDCAQMETVIRSRTNAVVYFIPKNIIVTAMELDASLAMKYALVCNKKIQFLIKRIELISTQSCRSKLAEYLISNKDAENCIIPNCSREVLASRIGISRAALFRELSELQKAKLIEVNSTTIKIINQVGLEHTIYS